MNLKINKTLKIIILLILIIITVAITMTLANNNQNSYYTQQLIEIIDKDEEAKLSEKELENYEINITKEIDKSLKENKDGFTIKQGYYAMAAVKYLQGENLQSIDYLNKALEYGVIYSTNKEIVECDVKIYSALSSNYIIQNNIERASDFFNEAKTIALNNNRKDLLCELYYGKAKAIASSGYNINESINLMRKALEYSDLENHKIRNYLYLSTLYKLTGDYDLSLEYTINALEIALKSNNSIDTNKCVISLGEVYYTQKNYSKTIYIYGSYFKENKLLDVDNKLTVYGYLTECYAKEGNYANYKIYRDKYISLAKEEEDFKNLVWIYLVCADLELENSNMDKAKEYLRQGKELYLKNKGNVYSNTDIMLSFIENKVNYLENKDYEQTLNNYKAILEKLNNRGVKSDINSVVIDEVLIISFENDDFATFKNYIKMVDNKAESSQTYTDSIYSGINNTIKEKRLFKEKVKTLIVFILFIVSICEVISSRRKNKKIKMLNLKLEKITLLDPLTQLYNRRYLSEKLKEIMNKEEEINFVMIDIDYFKLYNDNYGHINGDKVLIGVSDIIGDVFKEDIVFRYGGEEFCIISHKRIEETIIDIEHLKVKLNDENIVHEYSEVSDRVTLSIGVASRKISTENDIIEIIKKSDINLYKSKQNGRNRYTY